MNSVAQAESNADVHFQQVVDNLAEFCANPYALPRFAVATAGSNQVTDNLNGGARFAYTRVRFSGWDYNFGGSRGMTANWTLRPVVEPDRLARLRCAFQVVVGAYEPYASDATDPECIACTAELAKLGVIPKLPTRPVAPTPPIPPEIPAPSRPSDPDYMREYEAEKRKIEKVYEAQVKEYPVKLAKYELAEFPTYAVELNKFQEDLPQKMACNLPRGWFCTADCRRDVPDCACYVSQSGCRYVYVTPEGMDALARFTLTILTLASSDPVSDKVDVERRFDGQGVLQEFRILSRERVKTVDLPKQSVPSGISNLLEMIPGWNVGSATPESLLPTTDVEIRRDSRDAIDTLRSQIQLNSPL